MQGFKTDCLLCNKPLEKRLNKYYCSYCQDQDSNEHIRYRFQLFISLVDPNHISEVYIRFPNRKSINMTWAPHFHSDFIKIKKDGILAYESNLVFPYKHNLEYFKQKIKLYLTFQ